MEGTTGHGDRLTEYQEEFISEKESEWVSEIG